VGERVSGGLWTILLASGHEPGLAGMVPQIDGLSLPLQYCARSGEEAPLSTAMRLAQTMSGLERTVVVVRRAHRPFWFDRVVDLQPENVLVEPTWRGEGTSLLRALTHVARVDPQATVLVVPAWLRHPEAGLTLRGWRRLIEVAHARQRPVLLTAPQDGTAVGSRWEVVPRTSGGTTRTALRLIEASRPGALPWSGIIASALPSLMARFERAVGHLLTELFAAAAAKPFPAADTAIELAYRARPWATERQTIDLVADVLTRDVRGMWLLTDHAGAALDLRRDRETPPAGSRRTPRGAKRP
jgi:hypothetical protein